MAQRRVVFFNPDKASSEPPLPGATLLRLTCHLTFVQDRAYDRLLEKLLDQLFSHSSNKDKALTQFIVDLPELPAGEIERIRDMCLRPSQ